jgi:tetratricopeptide (TPR) repeat protein
MTNPLVEYETQAFEARNRGDFESAILLYEKIVNQNPNWEHGQAYYDLAGCYWDIGEIEKAKENYLRALNIQPLYYIFVGGYAAFLFEFGEPQIAFDWYLKLLKIESEFTGIGGVRNPDLEGMKQTKLGLIRLGEKMGWDKNEVETRIADYLPEIASSTVTKQV